MPAAGVVATLKAIFLMTAAWARLMPALVRPTLKASSGPGGDAYAWVVGLMDDTSDHPRGIKISSRMTHTYSQTLRPGLCERLSRSISRS